LKLVDRNIRNVFRAAGDDDRKIKKKLCIPKGVKKVKSEQSTLA